MLSSEWGVGSALHRRGSSCPVCSGPSGHEPPRAERTGAGGSEYSSKAEHSWTGRDTVPTASLQTFPLALRPAVGDTMLSKYTKRGLWLEWA